MSHPLRAQRLDGFTFVEVFAALVFLAILIPAIVEGLSIANRTSIVAERSTVAGELAENKLNEILLSSTGGTDVASTMGSGGDFGTDWPGYRWQMTQGTWDQDTVNTMSQLSVEVFYPVQGSERSVTLTTLVSGSGQNLSP
jgi:type II secretory pathway pseudopilin PulG